MDEMPEYKQTQPMTLGDEPRGVPFRTKRLAEHMALLAGVWAAAFLFFTLLCFYLPKEGRFLSFLGFLGANGFLIGWLLRLRKGIQAFDREVSDLMTHTRDMIWYLGPDFGITGAGGAAEPVAGKAAHELEGRPFAELLLPEYAKAFKEKVRQDRAFSMAARTGGDRSKSVEIFGTPVRGLGPAGGRDIFWGVIRDRSEVDRLEAVQKKLDHAEKMKSLGLLAGSVAHDLNNILSGISTYPEVLLLDNHLEPKVRQGLCMIQESGRKASSVVSDLLTISRGIKADKQILNINTVIQRFLGAPEFRKIQAIHDGVEIEVATEPELLNISGSYIHIEKALMNLILNAVEETASRPKGRVVLSTANYYADETLAPEKDLAPGEYVMIRVADNGAGIPENCLEKIFDPFYTQKEMGRSGTGLGLTVVFNTVKDHKGVIRVDSNDRGTRFDLFFPAIRAELPKNNEPGSIDEIRGRGETILVVDDLASQRKIADSILKKLGYTVFTVADGMAALAFVKKTPVDLLVLDMIMAPAISGLETYERISRIYPDQKAIIASGHSETEEVLKAQKLGAGSFVRKPYTILDMGIAVKEELEK